MPTGLALSGFVMLFTAGLASAQGLPEREFGEPWNGVGFGVRALGMGGAYTAVAEDIAGVYWNPGGLVKMQDTQMSFMTGDAYWKRRPELKDATKTVPYGGGLSFLTTAFRPWVTGLSVIRSFHSESIFPWQENFYMGTFVMPLNKAKTSAIGVNVKFMRSDIFYDAPRAIDIQNKSPEWATKGAVRGWAADAGVIYTIPMPAKDRVRELNVGFMARNAIGRSRVDLGGVVEEKAMPAQASLGMSFSFDDLVPRERSLLSMNFDQALRTTRTPAGGSTAQFRIGFEQWFFNHHSAMRVGFASPVPTYPAQVEFPADQLNSVVGLLSEGRPVYTVGLTVQFVSPRRRGRPRHTKNVLQLDIAATIPAELRTAEDKFGIPETQIIEVADNVNNQFWLPNDKPRFYAQITYHWPMPTTAPQASVAVEPLVFSPKDGEVSVFTNSYSDARGIEAWSLVVKNSARVPMRRYSGQGGPPTRLAWDGLDDRFNLVPDDTYTYVLSVRNRDGVETRTAPQSLRVYTPPNDGGRRSPDPELLRSILSETERRESAARAAVQPLISGQMKTAKESLAGESADRETVAGEEYPGDYPDFLSPVLPADEAMTETGTGSPAPPVGSDPTRTVTGGIRYRGLAPQQIVRVDIPSPDDPEGTLVTEYETQAQIFGQIAREVRGVTIQNYEAVGPTVSSFMVQARYGNHLLVIRTPMAVARGLKEGTLNERQWLRAAEVTLDGTPIEPKLD